MGQGAEAPHRAGPGRGPFPALSRGRRCRRRRGPGGEPAVTVRLTTAQALVRFLANQYSERDGQEQRLIPG
ncbi:hypothetical protein ACIOEX_14820, partial [Streptomyces sp. NPDC087850]|uniref:hypothetical protein n=1 Tax=Streptomyces sp. NPDC087850 TaxID=3365809 RepID=UPI0037FC018C